MLVGINEGATSVWFRTQEKINVNTSDLRYYAYYGNDTAANPPDNKSNIYLYYDGFDYNTLSNYNETYAFSGPYQEDAKDLEYNAQNGWVNYSGSNNVGKSMRVYSPGIRDAVIEADIY